ncbi:RIP metalloprotease RseP [Acidithiobacillus ferrivorans]|uniref:Zinc metalloprotease n=1 Tax=Acidithiobacillus ferrivorans TaxID=160808 RepID=A0A7T4WBS1_9PROT|nr:RIP metalloprotease RseP [Acidithiobacillus ferrivorans]MBN6740278.1 RIP metalloprotease RseP [Acidithiobacillus sp. MC6.1]QQD71698.1 RIP metalloprotease RseP [Acidithiobacillus ferrivorans]
MQILETIGAFILAIGILVLIHESGHFAVAKSMGVKILKFSIGFGPTLISRRWGRDQTEYVIAALPLGGYVKMLGEQDGEPALAEDRKRAFNNLAPGKRFLIALAGPVANLLFAIVAYAGVAWLGIPGLAPIVGLVQDHSLAAQAQLQPGERISMIDGRRVYTWEDVRMKLLSAAIARSPVTLQTTRSDGAQVIHVLSLQTLAADAVGPDLISKVIGMAPYLPAVIGAVEPHSPAQLAGLQAGDRLVAIDGHRIPSWEVLARHVESHPDTVIHLRYVTAQGLAKAVSLTPQMFIDKAGKPVGRIGISMAPLPKNLIVLRERGPLEGLIYGARTTWRMSLMTVEMIVRMVQGFISPDNISGPIAIAEFAGQSAQAGLAPFLSFLGLISISLGVLNLLPIPILDGGHLVFYAVEMVRGKALPAAVVQKAQQIGIVLLLMLMSFAFYNDIMRLLTQ